MATKAEEQPTTETSTTTTTTGTVVPHTIPEYILYKLDRTLAIVGIVLIVYLTKAVPAELQQIANVAVGGLVAFIGARTGNS